MTDPILRFDDLTYRYPRRSAPTLAGLTLDLPPGQVTALLGANGAGKSTLLRLAYGRAHPSSGRVLLEGRPLGEYPRAEIGRRVALVPQREYTPFEYSLLEYVLLGRAPHLHPLQTPGEADCQVAKDALATVGLAGMADRSLHAISGGEHQLVLIARALAQQASLLLLDEPTAHLDLANKQRLVNCLRDLRARGVTILLTSHEPEVVSAVADRIALMNGGRILHTGTPDEVWTEEFLSATYGIRLRVEQVDGRRLVLWD